MVMTENQTQVLVFKTSAWTEQEKYRIGEALHGLQQIKEWSVDMEDVDRVLRVVSRDADKELIILKLKSVGLDCCELDW